MVLLCVWTEGVNKCMRQQLVMVGEEVEAELQAGRKGRREEGKSAEGGSVLRLWAEGGRKGATNE